MTDSVGKRSSLGPTTRRLIRSYGLLIAIAIAFLLLALFVHEKDRTVPTESLKLPTAPSMEVR